MMPHHPLDHAARVQIIDRHLAGESLHQIATQMQISYYTARTYWRRYQQGGWAVLQPQPAGPPATGPLGCSHPRVKYVLLRLKRKHRAWGIDKLRLELTRHPSLTGIPIPQRSALAAYLAQFGDRLQRPRARPTRRPHAEVPPPTAPHQVWQMDFKGDERVAGIAGAVVPFMVCDTASGAPLAGCIHTVRSRGVRTGITSRTVQTDLRQVFAVWGLPDAVRMDRDAVFVGSSRLIWPGLIPLWLIGLGVQPIINRAYRPTDNAIVERNHQTWTAHVVIDQQYGDVAALQAATDAAYADRRTCLPSRHAGCGGRPPVTAFPTLSEPRRAYHPDAEVALFDQDRVDRYVAEWRWQRQVDSVGKISLNGRNYRVGRAYRGQMVRVRFDPTTRDCVCSLADGQEVKRVRIPEFQLEYLLGMNHPEPSQGGCN